MGVFIVCVSHLFSHLLLRCNHEWFVELVLGKMDAYTPECGPVVKPTEMERKQTQMERFDTMESGSMILPIVMWLFELKAVTLVGLIGLGFPRILLVCVRA